MGTFLPAKQVTVQRYGRSQHLYQIPGQEGLLLPSVTNILSVVGKPALINWAANMERELAITAAADLWEDLPAITSTTKKMGRAAYVATLTSRIGKTKAHQRELAKAAEIGSQAHALIEWNLRKELGQTVGPEPRISEKALWAFMVYEDWRKTVAFQPRAIEQVVWSTAHGYAGTMDVLAQAVLPGESAGLVVNDWKTGKAIYGEALLQNAAYVHALIEMGHADPPVHGLIVRLPKVESDPEPEIRVVPWAQHGALFEVFLAVKALWTWVQAQNAEDEAKKKAAVLAEQPSLIPDLQASLNAVTSRGAP